MAADVGQAQQLKAGRQQRANLIELVGIVGSEAEAHLGGVINEATKERHAERSILPAAINPKNWVSDGGQDAALCMTFCEMKRA
ncbi:hypothetical protein GCM10027044_11230 [Hymenobacter ruber]